MSAVIPLEYLVTFADETVTPDYARTSNNHKHNYRPGTSVDESPICLSDTIENTSPQSSHYHNKNLLPFHPYGFNPNIYQDSSLHIPRNLFRTVRENLTPQLKEKKSSVSTRDSSISKYMPHWNYNSFTNTQQEQFISKHFPEHLGLYYHYKLDEERNNLFVYLWIYINGGLYISSEYEILKPIDIIFDSSVTADLYFTFDYERYISPKILASQPFCGFWMEVVNLMEKRKNHHYPQISDQIDRNTGRILLTDVVAETQYKYEILPRSLLDPYNPCDTSYDKDSYLRPVSRNINFLTYMKCQTGSSDELLYITGAIIFVICIMILIALITH